MISGDDKNTNAKQRKSRSIFGTLFIPEIGRSMRPLGDAANMFVTLLAMVFVMNGLLPKDHPATTGKGGLNVSLSGIFRDAHSRLTYTKEGMPKVILYYAVVGCLVFSCLAVLTFVLTLFVGHAHAQTATTSASGYFTAPAPTTDLALQWLNYLFNNSTGTVSMPGCGASGAITTTCTSNALSQALQIALGYYSDAVLIFAAIILFYHLSAMIVHTAHHGVPMGKNASQIWAPIRLVVAIALLVPISGGLNSGQKLVVQIAEWGSGLASNVWAQFTTALASESVLDQPRPPESDIVNAVMTMEMCKYIYNYYVDSSTTDPTDRANSEVGMYSSTDSQSGTLYNFGIKPPTAGTQPTDDVVALESVCGHVYIPGPSTVSDPTNPSLNALASAVNAAENSAFLNLEGSTIGPSVGANGDADAMYNCFIPQNTADPNDSTYYSVNADCKWVDPTSGQPAQPGIGDFSSGSNAPDMAGQVASNQFITTLMSNYLTDLEAQLSSAMSSLNYDTDAGTLGGEGWIAAGAYFNDIARLQGTVTSLFKDGLPRATLGNITQFKNAEAKYLNSADIRASAAHSAAEYSQWLSLAAPTATKAATSGTPNSCPDPAKALDPALAAWVALGVDGNKAPNWDPIDYIFALADHVAAVNCLWHWDNTSGNSLTLGVRFDAANPLASIAAFGHQNLKASYELMQKSLLMDAMSVAANVSQSLTPGGKVGTAVKSLEGFGQTVFQILGGIASGIALIFFICGFTLAFYVPLIPFIGFFFGSVSWIALVLEGVVMMPLVALAHLNPEGDGLPGANAKIAYSFIFSIMLRPVLMIFGLVCGLLVFISAVFLLNQLFLTAAISAGGGVVNGHVVMSRIIFSFMYCVLVYIAANNSFKLTHLFPDHAMSWMGQQAKTGPGIGEPGDLGGKLGLASGYVSQKMMEGSQKLTQQVNQGIDAGQNASESRGNAVAAAKKHAEMMGGFGRIASALEGKDPAALAELKDGLHKTVGSELGLNDFKDAIGGKGPAGGVKSPKLPPLGGPKGKTS